ncbi:unnamed protein product [Durusdinium trenchii]|uniref:Uncharacterized protein n=2 Tax=Durusdinium trenchii TaxID=1381693 RepID=A0ABP0LBG8_9DINO
MELSPTIATVLARYPDVTPSSLNFPADAAEWTEKEVDLFIGSGGFLKPKRKKAADPPTAQSAPAIAAQAAAAEPIAPAIALDSVARAEGAVLIGYASNADRPAEVVSTPGVATLPELPLTSWHEDAYWAPYATYMEDVGEKGLRLTAALNKCERFRNVGLKKGAGFTLNALKEKFGAGILLREFALEMTLAAPSDIMSLLWVSLRLELPCSPFMPMYQVMVPEGSTTPVCKGVFGMLMLNTATMSVLNDNRIYEEVAAPLRKAFNLNKPNGSEGVPKFPRIYPSRGSPFRPTQLLGCSYTIMPSDCDMYRVIFHPQMVAVCEKVNYAVGAPFCGTPAVAIYANLAKPAGVDDQFDVRVFVEATAQQHRVLYLFSAAGVGVMTAFLVYGAPPGQLFSEDITACGAPKFGALETFGRAVAPTPPAPDKSMDLTRCSRS